MRFIFYWIFAINYLHAENVITFSSHPTPIIMVTEGAIIYSSDSVCNTKIITLTDRKKTTVRFQNDEVYITAKGEIPKISMTTVTRKKITKNKSDKAIINQHKPNRLQILIIGSAEEKLVYHGSEETGFCIVSSPFANKIYRKNEPYETHPISLFSKLSNEHKLHHNDPLLSFYYKLQIPRGPPQL